MAAWKVPQSSLWTILVVAGAWLHGATVGVAHGDESLKQLFWVSIAVLVPSVLLWQYPTAKRVLASALFFFSSSFFMCLMSSVTWFRNPKREPLPDLVHDLIPPMSEVMIPYTNKTFDIMPDLMIGILLACTVLFVALQQGRWIILRRIFVIYGALCLLRSVTIVLTSLPDPHKQCQELTPGTRSLSNIQLREIVVRALWLLVPVGTVTCGDMVFSGHSMLLVLCGMVWHTYFRVYRGTYAINTVKVFMWTLVAVGLGFIIATRLHYTLDVFLAVFLTTTTWGTYHRLAHDVLYGNDRFVSVYIVDGAIVYPAIEWLEGVEGDMGDTAPPGSTLRVTSAQLRRRRLHEQPRLQRALSGSGRGESGSGTGSGNGSPGRRARTSSGRSSTELATIDAEYAARLRTASLGSYGIGSGVSPVGPGPAALLVPPIMVPSGDSEEEEEEEQGEGVHHTGGDNSDTAFAASALPPVAAATAAASRS